MTIVKDSGKRETFETGSVRDSRDGKGRFDLISPYALDRLAKHYEAGAAKYGDHNWTKGQPFSRYVDSALRHINRFMMGHADEDHLAAVVFNIFALLHQQEMVAIGSLSSSLDDMPEYRVQNGIPRTETFTISEKRNPWYPYDNKSDWKDALRRESYSEVQIESMAREATK